MRRNRRAFSLSLSHHISRIALVAALSFGVLSSTGRDAMAQSTPAVADTSTPAVLVADQVAVDGPDALVAQGNVLIQFQGVSLTAQAVRFDQSTNQLTITGPIVLQNGPDQMILADAAELSSDLRNGILHSARLVLNQQLQVAAVDINRSQSRYTLLNKVTASSCQVCAKNPVPLWQIRAERVLHDEKERQLYFTNAQLRFANVPVLYLPRLRLPDPTLKRATGFLAPKLRTRTTFGTGLLTPYFIRLGDHADLTLSPFIATKSYTLEWQYRQAFHTGGLSFTGAVSDDQIKPGDTRYYVFGQGSFDLPQDFRLSFQLQAVSDSTYLLDYGYSDADRLRNALELSRVRRDELIYAGLIRYETLRTSELPISDQLSFIQGELQFQRRFSPKILGGMAEYELSAQGYFRESRADVLGRDVTRLGASLNWRRDWQLRGGLIAALETSVNGGIYWIDQDSNFDRQQSFVTPTAAATLRWPLSRISANGTVDVIEPVAQLVWSDRVGATLPNEDSLYVEFDESNLFDLSRYPGFDRQEEGTRANLGLTWSRYSPSGWSMILGAGRVFRFEGNNNFSNASGLAGDTSDWLVAAQLQFGSQFAIQGRALFDDSLALTKAESRFAYLQPDWQLSASHLWVTEDLAENRKDPIHELRLEGGYQITDNWRLSGESDVDLSASQVTKGKLGLEYRNECLLVDLSLSRRFTASANINPTTDFGFQVELLGFGGASAGPARKCM